MNSNANVMETVEQAIQPAAEAARTAARANVQRTLDSAKASLHNGKDRIRATARHAAENTNQYVHSNAWSAVGIAVAAGAAIALLLRTRMQR